MSAFIKFEEVTLSYPIYSSANLSLRRNILSIGTGGRLQGGSGHITHVTALDNVSFDIRQGDAIGLIGHNGAGKSTLLRTMAGIYVPLQGNVRRNGSISTMFELGAGADPELSGYENIIRMGLMNGLSLREILERTPEIEEFTELGDFLQLPMRTYSSGMTMRLMFAVATCASPDILLVDEVINTGDEAFQTRATKRMHEFLGKSQIFVLATHSHEVIKEHCNRVFRLEHGTVQEIPMTEI